MGGLEAAGTVPSIGRAVDEAEEALFIGRVTETAAFEAALHTCADAPRVLYVHGPVGVGKTTLLRAWGRRAARLGLATVAVDGGTAGASPQLVVQRIADALQHGAAGAGLATSTPEEVLRAANGRARAGGLVLLLDTYEALLPCDPWLRADLLYGLGPGTCVVLAGRRPPEELWPDAPGWLAIVQSVELGGLGADDAALLLRRRGVQEPAVVEEAVCLADGRPLLLSLAASVILRAGGTLPPAPRAARGGTLALALLSHLIRQAPHVEALLAAAALVPTFDRALLAAMLDTPVSEQNWQDLCSVPVVTPVGDRHALHEAVRGPLAAATCARRPWVERNLRRRAIEHHLSCDGGAMAWSAVAKLASHTLWHSWLHPQREREEGWRLTHGAMAGDVPAMARLLGRFAPTAMMGNSPDEVGHEEERVAALVAAWPAGFVLARESGGALLGYLAAAPARPETHAVLLGEPRAGPYVATWPAEAWDGSALFLCHVGLTDPASEVANALFREAICSFAPYARVIAVSPDPQTHQTLPQLGFHRDPTFSGLVRGTTASTAAFVLDLGAAGYSAWLRRLVGLAASAGLPEAEWSAAAHTALEAWHDAARLADTTAARYFAATFGSAKPALLQEWVADCLAEVERTMEHVGGAMLRLYHLERAGSHEALAERLGLPPRTYFRRRREALKALGECLFRP